MKKLTDEMVAKALGWKKHPNKESEWYYIPGRSAGKRFDWLGLPAFTTSLDAIVGEIESMGLYWIVARQFGNEFWASIRTKGAVKVVEKEGVTAPLALCHALLAYLKEKP